MPVIRPWRRVATVPVVCLVLASLAAGDSGSGWPQAQQSTPGVTVTYRSGAAAPDTAVSPGLALHVPQGTTPTPFLPSGPFTAEMDGELSVDLRDDYQFRAELSGSARITIGDALVLTAEGSGTPVTTTKPVRLNRGANRIRVAYTSPAAGDAYLRLHWSSPAIGWEPIPAGALSRPAGANPALDRGQQLRTGRMLILEYRCTRCHKVAAESGEPLAMDAPTFDGIGLRRNQEWMARWIANPRALRRTARMPTLLHGPDAAVRPGG